MKGFANECGGRNNFGYYDQLAKEIMLRRPCTRKKDIEEVYCWLDKMTDLHRFNIGLGPVESFVSDGNTSGLYTEARNVLKAAVLKNKELDLSVDCYNKVLESNPLNHDVLVKLATVLQTYFPDRLEDTIDCYEKLLEMHENKSQIYYELGHLYLRKEDKINSISAFKLALEHDCEINEAIPLDGRYRPQR